MYNISIKANPYYILLYSFISFIKGFALIALVVLQHAYSCFSFVNLLEGRIIEIVEPHASNINSIVLT